MRNSCSQVCVHRHHYILSYLQSYLDTCRCKRLPEAGTNYLGRYQQYTKVYSSGVKPLSFKYDGLLFQFLIQ